MPSESEYRSTPTTRRDKRNTALSVGSKTKAVGSVPSSQIQTRDTSDSVDQLINRLEQKDPDVDTPGASSSQQSSTPLSDGGSTAAIPGQTLQRDQELWFDDGNLVLVAGGVQFCVYKGLLTSQSAVFKDMLSLPQPSVCDATVEPHDDSSPSRASVHLSDSPEDLRHFLRAFTNGKLRDEPGFDEVSACIRLGHKYQCDAVVQSYIGYLKKYYVDNFDSWWDVTTFDPPGFRPIHRIGTVNLARLTGTASLLPVALMACCKLGAELGDGFAREDGTLETLAYADVVRCFVGKARLTEASFVAVHRMFRDVVAGGCKHPAACKGVLQRLLQHVVENAELMEDIRALHFDDAKTGYVNAVDTARALCARCYEMVGEAGRQDEQRRDIFRRLPEMMGVEVENWDASGDASEDGDVKSESEVSL